METAEDVAGGAARTEAGVGHHGLSLLLFPLLGQSRPSSSLPWT